MLLTVSICLNELTYSWNVFLTIYKKEYLLVRQRGRPLFLAWRIYVQNAEILQQRSHVHVVEEWLEAGIWRHSYALQSMI